HQRRHWPRPVSRAPLFFFSVSHTLSIVSPIHAVCVGRARWCRTCVGGWRPSRPGLCCRAPVFGRARPAPAPRKRKRELKSEARTNERTKTKRVGRRGRGRGTHLTAGVLEDESELDGVLQFGKQSDLNEYAISTEKVVCVSCVCRACDYD